MLIVLRLKSQKHTDLLSLAPSILEAISDAQPCDAIRVTFAN